MDLLFILIGVVTAAVVFFYAFTNVAEKETDDRIKAAQERKKADAKPGRDVLVGSDGRPRRFCPICASEMGPGDKLYAEVYKASPRDKVFIKGCPRCNTLPGKPESRPDFVGALDM